MATYKVSTQSQLKSALNSAKGGDSIVLKAGNYGTLNLSGEKYSSKVTITSESSSNPATFSKVYLSNVSNLAFSNVKFDYSSASGSSLPFNVKSSSNITFDKINFDGLVKSGYGDGVGLKVTSSSNVTVQNSDFTSFNKGMETWGNTNLKVLNNDFSNIGYDGIVVGHTQGVVIQGNDIDMHAHGDNHRDGIQFYNQGTKAPSSNITIKSNVIKTDDGYTHGIYFGNNDTKGSNTAEFYKNITIEGNTLKTGHLLGIAIGGAQTVSVKNNVVVQSDDFYSKKTVNQPIIIIDKDAKGVSVSGNTVLKAPAIGDDANNWTIVGTLSNSGGKIVALGASTSSASASASDTSTSTSSSSSSALTSSSDGDEFRFKGSDVGKGKTSKITVDFSDDDTIVLTKYDGGTFKDVSGGNVVHNNSSGSYVKIDTLTDLQELVKASKAISAKVSGDTLTIDIDQDSGVHHLVLAGLGHEYQNTYDATLF